MKLNKYIDHTLLKQDATKGMFDKLCEEAKEYDFKTVCVNPSWIEYCKEKLRGSDVKVCTVIGFPLGAMTSEAKAFEARQAVELGADEVDMVLNIGRLKNNEIEYVINDIKKVKEAIGDKVLKVIIETCLLTDEEKLKACDAIIKANADFVKTSTGFSTSGANLEDVKLLKKGAKGILKVKAAGGVRSQEDMITFIENGADRIGTSSGVKLMSNQKPTDSY
ncbi:MAG: deoxyribose-phosphate aldolase [Erysipelotrichaceae bacterium]|jgi:deoxyribose-phosphate aldolase|nr:deoxyribose-phosphate aldolase [Bacillota bacterium]NLP22709.1 deoxyribose-phosphate aldolase [Erysipelotrichaceae bacterium]HCY06007.1 deoxyribose-phosphate aldolase [Erysipelotrichaceae bacterium]